MAEIDYTKIPETARQDLLLATYRLAVKAFRDPLVVARYEEWLAKRKAAAAASTATASK